MAQSVITVPMLSTSKTNSQSTESTLPTQPTQPTQLNATTRTLKPLIERALYPHLHSLSCSTIHPSSSAFVNDKDTELLITCNVSTTTTHVLDNMLANLTDSLVSFHITNTNNVYTPTTSLIEIVPEKKVIDDVIEDEVLWQAYLRYYSADKSICVHKVDSKGDNNYCLHLTC